MNTQATLNRSSLAYLNALSDLRKNRRNVVRIERVYITRDNKICAVEWIDSNGLLEYSPKTDEPFSKIEFVD